MLQLSAVLIGGGPICSPQGEAVLDIIPSPEMSWAAVGRLALPNVGDTIKRVSEGILRADIGTNPKWRVTFDGARLAVLEKAEGRKVVERVTRGTDGTVTYVRGRRRLAITEVREENAQFSADIWRC
jgi:hypothetical protein